MICIYKKKKKKKKKLKPQRGSLELDKEERSPRSSGNGPIIDGNTNSYGDFAKRVAYSEEEATEAK